VNVSKHRQAIERMYTDRVTVYRHEKVKDQTTKATKLVPVVLYADQPCRLSLKQLAQNSQTEAQNDIGYESKLFIAPEAEIKQGDVLKVTRGRMSSTGWESIAPMRKYAAGEPFPYSTHQEISLQRQEWA
jgi:hypothetical protein